MDQDLRKTFPHLLATNNPPDALQAAVFRGELDSLTTRVSELQSLLKDLEDRICQRRTILSPLRRIPLDILGEIFTATIPERMGKVGRAQLVDLGLVCKSWRDAACLTHQLWSKIRITGESLTSFSYEKMVSWLGRSGSIPKTLEILNLGRYCDINTLVKLWTDGPSVETLYIHFNSVSAFHSLLGQLVSRDKSSQAGCPTRSLNLSFSLGDESPLLNQADALFDILPNTITSFNLRFLPEKCISGCLFPPTTFLNHLASLSLYADTQGTKLFTALTHCASLETLALDLSGYSTSTPEEGDNVSLPKLQTLHLRRVSHVGFSILVRLATPALIKLDIECENTPLDNGGQLSRAMKVLTERCPTVKTQLRSLRLCNLKIIASESTTTHDSSFTDILLCVPSLTKLTLDGVMCLPQDDVFNGIRYHLRWLEVLEFLGVSYIRGLVLVTVRLLEFLAKGERPGGLRQVVFESRDFNTVESHPATQELRTAGVLVTFAASTP